VADVAAGVPSPEAAAFLWQQIQSANQLGPSGLTWVHHTARYGSAEVTTQLVTLAQQRHVTDRMQQVAWWREIDRGLQARGSGPREAMAAWASRLATELLDSKHAPERLAGAELAGAQRLDDAKTRLTAIVRTGGGDESLRRAACTSLVAIDPDQAASLLGMVLRGADEASGLREHVAVLLGSLNLPAARDQLVEALRVAPERLQGVIAFALAGTRAGAEQLLENIAAGKAAARLLLERPIHLRLAQHQLPQLDARIRQLTAGLPSPDQRLQQLLHQRRTEFRSAARDSAAGARVFKQHCMACHQLGGAGSKVGPQLDGIGVRGLDRLLEDTLDPSRNVDQAFRATNLALKDGRVLLGLLLREEGEVLVVADAQGQEQRIAKSDIEEKALLPLSPMPANFQDRIPADEFYHLLAFLLSQRGTAP
jgi:putative heme-binding domain-containing protein